MSKIRTWCNFTVKRGNENLKLRIQDAPTNQLTESAELFGKYFVTEETFHKAAGVGNNTEALEESKEFSKELTNDKNTTVIICCKDDNTDACHPIAVSMMALEKKDEPEDFDLKTKTKEMARMFEYLGGLYDKFDVMKELNLDSLYDDRGIVVHPDYRGLGIAQKLFNIRRVICKAEGIPLTGAWMTSFGSQKAAERDGWETAFEIPYEELSKEYGVTFENVPLNCKYMIAKPI